MTQLLSEIVQGEFEAEKASGSSTRIAISILADRHGRSEENIRAMLASRGVLKSDADKAGLFMKGLAAAVFVAIVFWFTHAQSPHAGHGVVQPRQVADDAGETSTIAREHEAALSARSTEQVLSDSVENKRRLNEVRAQNRALWNP